MENVQRQGIGENDYPQYGTDFWGNSANNYGFGIRNIEQNVQNHPAMNMISKLKIFINKKAAVELPSLYII